LAQAVAETIALVGTLPAQDLATQLLDRTSVAIQTQAHQVEDQLLVARVGLVSLACHLHANLPGCADDAYWYGKRTVYLGDLFTTMEPVR
jgi:hypothetical protein